MANINDTSLIPIKYIFNFFNLYHLHQKEDMYFPNYFESKMLFADVLNIIQTLKIYIIHKISYSIISYNSLEEHFVYLNIPIKKHLKYHPLYYKIIMF